MTKLWVWSGVGDSTLFIRALRDSWRNDPELSSSACHLGSPRPSQCSRRALLDRLGVGVALPAEEIALAPLAPHAGLDHPLADVVRRPARTARSDHGRVPCASGYGASTVHEVGAAGMAGAAIGLEARSAQTAFVLVGVGEVASARDVAPTPELDVWVADGARARLG